MRDLKSRFFVLLGLFYFISSLGSLMTVVYICHRISWLGWIMQAPFPTIYGFFVLCSPSLLLGIRCKSCTPRSIFIFGALLTLILGILNNLSGMLEWFFLMKCMPEKYTSLALRTATVAVWITLPIGAVLGGMMSLISHKYTASKKR